MTSSGELYHAAGIERRRPAQSWRLSLSPQVTVFGEFGAGLNILVSSEGSDLRQNISQFGFNPRYRWITLHVGDFTQDYSPYTLQGSRIRGGGFDLRPGWLRFSVQGGQAQRTVAAGATSLAYRRNLYAASAGVGRDGSSFIDLIVVRAKDDVSSLAPALADTILLDTIPVALRPRVETRPQENLVLGARAALNLFGRRLALKGDVAGALITRDLESPDAKPESVDGGGTLSKLMPLRLSTSGDYAAHIEAEANLGGAGLRGGYEYVGAGYTSLGLAYLINDRRAYNVGANVRLARGHLSLQGQYQHQNDNLLNQKLATTRRDALAGTLVLVAGRGLSTSITALINTTANDAAVDTFRIDNRAFAISTNTAAQVNLGRPTTVSLSYALQRTSDQNVLTRIPDVTVHNLSTSVQVQLSKALSVAPTGSLAITRSGAAPEQTNVHAGFRGQARVGRVRASVSAAQSYSNSRGIFSANGLLAFTLPSQAQLQLQGRHNRYAAIGNRPAFQETFATMSLTRSF
jgi:hypothetical protein